MKNQVYSVRQFFSCLGTVTILLLLIAGIALAQTTAFSYQGKLTDNGTPASGNYDLTFKLFDTATVGSGVQQGATLSLTNVAVSGGVFTVTLDFGACASCFNGATRFLEIAVKPSSGTTFTTLTPRQGVTATPYALRSVSATTADGLSVTCVSCVTSSQIQSVNGSVVNGTIPVASVPAGSDSYIQNTTGQQATSNFNISGDGTAGGVLSGNIINATLSYRLGGQLFLSGNASNNNLRLGFNISGAGSGNTLIGNNAAVNLTTGTNHTFLGANTGNLFFNGNNNTLLGANTTVTTGMSNATAIGANASVTQSNSLVLGNNANVGIGTTAPISQLHLNANAASFAVTLTNFANTAGRRGYRLAFDNDRFTFQRADDAGNFADNQVAIEQATGNVGIGTTAPAFRLHVEEPGNLGLRVGTSTTGGKVASFGPFGEFQIDAPNIPGGRFVVKETGKVGIGTTLPDQTLTVNGNASKSSGGTTWAVFSDERLKTIKGWFTPGLSTVLQLQPILYEYKADNALGLNSNGEAVGFSAQAVEKVLPEAVSRSSSGYLQLNSDPILWAMLNAIKEQQAQIERQQAEIESLKKLVCSSQRKAGVCK